MKISLIRKKKLKRYNFDNLREECGVFGISNHEEASAMCAEMGGRLCTAEELLGDCTRDTGCGHNHDLIWSSTEAPPDAGNTDTGSEAEGKKRKKGGGKKEGWSALAESSSIYVCFHSSTEAAQSDDRGKCFASP